MGGKLFQNALVETAAGMGVIVDTTDGFKNTLEESWLSSEILMETLKKFAVDESMLEAATKVKTFTQLMDTLKEAAQSGWGQSMELIIGDFEEAKELFRSEERRVGKEC